METSALDIPSSLQKHLDAGKAILFFDGVCNYCSGLVRFILPRDTRGQIIYASLQSQTGQWLLSCLDKEIESLNTVYLLSNKKLLLKSDAAFAVCKKLKAPWSIFGIGQVVPKLFRDPVYDMVARSRYRIFGKSKTCYVPPASERHRFIETI